MAVVIHTILVYQCKCGKLGVEAVTTVYYNILPQYVLL